MSVFVSLAVSNRWLLSTLLASAVIGSTQHKTVHVISHLVHALTVSTSLYCEAVTPVITGTVQFHCSCSLLKYCEHATPGVPLFFNVITKSLHGRHDVKCWSH